MKPALVLACITCLCLPSIAAAEAPASEPARSVHWNNGAIVGTDYIWRGQSLTDGKPSLVGEVKLSHDNGFYAGIWAGNLDLGPQTDTSVEIDYFLGWAKRYGPVSLNVGYLYRQRPSDALALDFQEASVSASYDFGVARLGASGYYSWDYFQGGRSTYHSANLSVPIAQPHGVRLVAIATAGHYYFSNRAIGDYDNVDLRLVAKHGSLEYSVGYSDTTVDPARSGLLTRDESGSRWRAQVLVMF
jgi:uncharacterized protein (TIGR02001 family)